MSPQKTPMPITKKLAIGALVLLFIVFIVFSIRSATDPNREKIYTDPNNGEQVIENPTTEPELDPSEKLVVTGKGELIDQGVSSDAVGSLDGLFLQFNKDIQLASIVSKSVRQYRDDPNSGFSYSFEVQIDKDKFYLGIINSTDSTTGEILLYNKDKSKMLVKTSYSLGSSVEDIHGDEEE